MTTTSSSAHDVPASPRQVPCPACSTPAPFAKDLNPYRPFCSLRCREHDLGAWACGGYRVGAVEPPDDFDAGA
ncbi:MAG: gyrase inhibitor YacG [Pseudomonadota bacterium]|jgi:endogenous inhibitor of DNA gyrase (YacG/DUF329 family)